MSRNKILLYLSPLLLLLSFSMNAYGDSIEDHVQLQVLEERVKGLEEKLNSTETRIKESADKHHEQVKELMDKKEKDIDWKMGFYIGGIVIFTGLIAWILNYFGRETLTNYISSQVGEFSKEKIDAQIQLKMSDGIIDKKCTQFLEANPAIKKLIADFEKNKIEYENLLAELKEKQKDFDSEKATQQEKEKTREFVEILKDVKEEKDFTFVDWMYKARVEFENKNYEKAILFLDKAIELNPSNDIAFTNRGITKGEIGKHKEAILDHDKALELNPKNDTALASRGAEKNVLGTYEDAILDCNKALELNPRNASAYNNRGYSKNALGRYEDAILDCNKAIELYSLYANPYKHRAFAKMKLNRLKEALDDVNKAIKLMPDYNEAIELREEILKLMEDK